jgi:hypothetical protein
MFGKLKKNSRFRRNKRDITLNIRKGTLLYAIFFVHSNGNIKIQSVLVHKMWKFLTNIRKFRERIAQCFYKVCDSG